MCVVRRLDEFLISKRPYAVGLESLSTTRRETGDGRPHWYCRCAAVWYRRRSGVLVSVLGTLWDYQDQEPTTVLEFVERHTDGRYGGTALGRWDGTGYWGAEDLATRDRHLELLRPMLDRYPEVPSGYDGWWTFQPKAS